MSSIRFCLVFLISALVLSSCQKQLGFSVLDAQGTLKDNSTGDCLPVTIYGAYQKDTLLLSSNAVDVQVNFTQLGNYTVKTDTLNGYSFSATGTTGVLGLTTIHMQASGRPILPGVDVFHVKFDTSTCEINIIVTGAGGGTAAYTLGGAGSTCTGATLAGTYTAGIPTTSANTVTLNVNVTALGTYTLSSTTNGVTFAGSGNFTTLGPQTIVLTAAGTPTTAGTVNYSVTSATGTCSFSVTYATPTPAAYTFPGAPGACTVATPNGTYGVGIALNSSNTLTVQVNVTSTGVYTISTNTVNGISFSGIGAFSSTGVQNVTLAGSGTPTTAGANNLTVGTAGCTFTVTVLGPAAYTFAGAPGACTVATVNGTYSLSTPLSSANTVDVQVNVTTPGTYTITTSAGGMTFSKSGTFAAAGLQTVSLAGSGTPTTAGANNFTVGTAGCTFTVTVAAAPSGIFHAMINGVLTDFSTNASGTYFYSTTTTSHDDMFISGDGIASPVAFSLDIDKTSSGSGAVGTGTYPNTLSASISGGYILGADYTDPSNTIYAPRSIIDPSPDPFTITITTINATRVIGTFSGTIRDNFGTGTNTLSVTNGVFDLPIL